MRKEKATDMEMTIDVNALPIEGEGGLIDLLKTIVDPRKPRGVRHPVVTITAIAILAALSGARSFQAIADWAKGLSREALRKLGSKRWKPPSEPTIRRVLQGLNAAEVDAKTGDRKSTRLNSSHLGISYAVFCLKKKKKCNV